jgi:hypothetical protein
MTIREEIARLTRAVGPRRAKKHVERFVASLSNEEVLALELLIEREERDRS